MLSLNLLSKRQKKEAKNRRLNSLLRQLSIVLLLLFIIISLLLWGAKKVLKNNFIQLTQKDIKITNFDSEIKKSNELADFLKEIQDNYITWSDFLIELSLKTPNNIQLTSIQINKKENNIIINGWAPKRNDLLNFKNNLEDSLFFKNVSFPIQNIAQKEDIDFIIKAEINTKTKK